MENIDNPYGLKFDQDVPYDELLQVFCDSFNLGIVIKDEFIEIKFFYEYAPDFNYVDGEEGDNGLVFYYDEDKDIICIKIIHGGDDVDYEFTDVGKSVMSNILEKYFKFLIDKI